MTETKTKLESGFTFYFRITDKKLQGGKNDYQDSVKKMAEFSTVEDFWKIFQHIKKPESLKSGIEIQLFKNPIKPMWEDESNKDGGRLSIRIKKDYSSLVWEELVLDMLSGSFPKTVKEQLNGIVDKFVDIMVKQVCLQMNEIRHDRENGVPVEKKLAALRNLIKDSGLADLQNNEAASQGVGMTARDIEFHRPVREPDKELNDVDNIGGILIGFLGGTSRAIGKENEFTEVFDKVYDKYTIDIIDNLRHQYGLDFSRQGGDSDAQSHDNDKTQEESIEVKD